MSESTAVAKRPIHLNEGGLVKIETYEDAYRYAVTIVKSGLAPNSFKTPEAVMVAMQQGAELGLKPMQSLQHIAVINGRPSIYGKAATGIVVSSGLLERFEEWFEGDEGKDNFTACCKVKRKGLETVKTAKFSLADAKRAKLVNKSVWQEYTRDMLMYKARARAFSIFSDVLCGLSFVEDIQEVPEERPPINKSNSNGNGKDPLLEEMEIVQEPEIVEAEEVQPEPETDPLKEPIGVKRANKLYQLATKKFPGDDAIPWLKERVAEFGVEGGENLNAEQEAAILDQLEKMPNV